MQGNLTTQHIFRETSLNFYLVRGIAWMGRANLTGAKVSP